MSNESNGLHHLRFREKEKKGEEKKEKKNKATQQKIYIFITYVCMHV